MAMVWSNKLTDGQVKMAWSSVPDLKWTFKILLRRDHHGSLCRMMGV